MATEFKLPDLGEGVKAAEVSKVLVKPGEVVVVDQNLLEVETDKAATDVPSSVAGTVVEVRVKPGDSVPVGGVLLLIDESTAGAASASGSAAAPPVAATAAAAPEPLAPVATPAARPAPGAAGDPVFAAPSVRKFAREIGVDIKQVVGSGPGGRISSDDVKAFARSHPATAAAGEHRAAPAGELPDFTRWGAVERQRLSNVRRVTAQAMARSWATVPHVTIFDRADITDLEALRNKVKGKAEKLGAKLTITAMMLKLAAGALKVHPTLNASLDLAHNEVVLKRYVHVGVAADTDRGLVVPVVRDVDQKSMLQIAVELGELAAKARAGKLTPDEMQGGSFTVTNLGGLGVGHFTPIVNSPEVAILGLGRATQEPVWVAGGWQPRLLLPLSLSFDHRLVDGADGARFLRWIVEAIEEPLMLVLEG
ncbi:MAG: 2-oxo acid dehydrogenase subunit E2 [Fimbriimonadaceae bacterium]|nr:2-oxo acid dehydrogenase subunit E2 [Fimbriimonadaceae bacterium]